MKSKVLLTLLVAGVTFAALPATQASAQTNITQLDTDTIRVIDYSGKPPHKRLIINKDTQPQLFGHYAERVTYEVTPSLLSQRRGAPGKSLPRSVLKVSSEPGEIAEFARFEEEPVSTETTQRAWRGAPGKGRSLAR